MIQAPDKEPNRGIKAILRIPLLTMGLWVVLGGLGLLLLPSVDHVVASQSNAGLPADAPTLIALKKMDNAFGSGGSKSFVLIVFQNANKLSTVDQSAYSNLVTRLHKRPGFVAEVQDYLSDANLKKALTSTDGQAAYLPVGLTAAQGSVEATEQVLWVRAQVKDAALAAGDTRRIFVTGDSPGEIDITALATSANQIAGIVSMILLFFILLGIYRRFVSVFVPLVTIGIATLCTNSVLALAGEAGMGLSTYTESFCLAIVLGAGTDYSIFLVSRFREEYARTGDVYKGVTQAMIKIGPALLASAGTVAISAMVLNFAQLSVFRTTGPAMAVAVGTTVVISLTVTPAMLLLVGKSIGPAPVAKETSFWNRVGNYVAIKPTRILLGGTAALILLAAFVPTAALAYADSPADPHATEAAYGQQILNDHFGKYKTQPDYVLITADHDMRNSKDLAILAAVSRDIAKVPTVASVSSAAQPGGKAIKDSRITSQLNTVAESLSSAANKIKSGKGGLTSLQNGTTTLANGADQQAAGMRQATNAMPRLISGLSQLTNGEAQSAAGARRLANAVDQIRSGLRQLANGLDQAHSGASQTTYGIGQVVQALNSDATCGQSSTCSQARSALAQIYSGQHNRLVPGLGRSASAAQQLASGQAQLTTGLQRLASGLAQSVGGHEALNSGQSALYGGMSRLSSGSSQLASGLAKLPSGVKQIVDNTLKLSNGLSKTGSYLSDVSQQSDTADAGGFYLPNSALDSTAFSTAIKQFLSPDGRVARIQYLSTTSPGSTAGLNRFGAVKSQVVEALKGTTLDGSDIAMTGASGGSADLRDYFKADFKLVLIAVLLTVLILMMIVLRSLIAPLYLLVSVILSYGAALGSTVLIFHQILGQEMPFNVPVLSFVLLVAVGADYNILLMSRMRESKGRLTPKAVGRAVTATGPVITSAGIIFSSAFLPMVASTLSAVSQLCFTVVIGLLLDTFIVRTLIVPACAALLGDKSWWPGHSEASDPTSTVALNSGFALPRPRVLAPPIMTMDTL